jgi:hypothetical protein
MLTHRAAGSNTQYKYYKKAEPTGMKHSFQVRYGQVVDCSNASLIASSHKGTAYPGNNQPIQGTICRSREESADPGNNLRIQGTICRPREQPADPGSNLQLLGMYLGFLSFALTFGEDDWV